ncbi:MULTISPECIES: hypothetical protein [unclassified Pseudonocardia]|jgi:hypothetical protein|uniref:hypothetical protein n=1 Tax=unclassified Pseudonocardia TaxID=2619320 RepID=UPI0001FFEC09|nr:MULTISPECIES: hypothetical protein [unclassified Pseudonocardia]ALE73197.1 hypothetical protein FRP1_09045 [Pseudonocardia sp. EC080625-04]ALL76528.1 hypothetical protein AD006_16610 [Pseudonocardia sp. EC080610-09]ALL83554.1 hypothetical protein AD017_24445 [Pseudonocardia sp. EC080619-01]OLM19139.1 hypothetical protein Ae707Ps1_3398 [Pseudonocardia sp. Ae707_Ps1]
MSTTIRPLLSHRDRAVLRAIAADRCTVTDGECHSLTIDGVCFCDQFAGVRLADDGLVEASGAAPLRPHLTDAGRSLLAAA